MQATGRLFLCAHCRAQVIICRRCDRGQRYCKSCAKEVRRTRMREAGRRYQKTRQGRFAHAERARRYRARRKKVTHQGSPIPTSSAVLRQECDDHAVVLAPVRHSGLPGAFHCHRCAVPLPHFVRTGPLRRRGCHSQYRSDGGGNSS